MTTFLDLSIKEHSYLFGFLQGDGHLYKNRIKENKGKLQVELNIEDKPFLLQLQQLIPFYSSVTERKRDTNFRKESKTAIWTVSSKQFRDELLSAGLPIGRKSTIISLPNHKFHPSDYFRGLIDADGSVGTDKNGLPFINLTTGSDYIASAYMEFIFSLNGKLKQQKRNKRDDIYNILVWKEDAIAVASVLYYEGCLSLPRKYDKASSLLNWQRPIEMKRVPHRQKWTEEQDLFILSHSVEESMTTLNRNKNSIVLRRNRILRKAKQSVTD